MCLTSAMGTLAAWQKTKKIESIQVVSHDENRDVSLILLYLKF